MKLSSLKAGCRAKIKKILEDKEVKIKLSSLGVLEDMEIDIVKNDFKGAVILAIRGNRIIVGRDLAENIEIF
jgi:Fe2+ transport system protein FeoA